jgi:hypothetical protein
MIQPKTLVRAFDTQFNSELYAPIQWLMNTDKYKIVTYNLDTWEREYTPYGIMEAVTPQPYYEIKFEKGITIKASATHKWFVAIYETDEPQVVCTYELSNYMHILDPIHGQLEIRELSLIDDDIGYDLVIPTKDGNYFVADVNSFETKPILTSGMKS